MEEMVTITAKIPKRLRERIKKSHMNVSKRIRKLLEEDLLYEEARKLDENIRKHKKTFEKISVEEVVRSMREDRER